MGKQPDSQTVTQESSTSVDIPNFLKPFLKHGTNVSSGALSGLENLLGGATAEDLVAGFTPAQLQGQQGALDIAGGAGGFIPTAQQGLLSTAQGDFLSGGGAFQDAVDAAVRSAQPHILSTFGGSGRGTGGLAQAAIGQAATDAFAGLFNQERNRQQQAQQLLPGIGLLPSEIQNQIGALQQAQQQQEINAPINAQQQLLQSGLAGLPIGNLLGSSTTGTTTTPLFSNPAAGFLGGGLAGLGLGASTAAPGATGLAALGGPLGLGLGAAGGLLGLL